MQRKVFRVEAMMAGKRQAAYAGQRRAEQNSDDSHHRLSAELMLVRDTIARHKRALREMIGSSQERHMARASDELGAAVDGMETATQKILKSVEVIDDSAKALTASLRDDYKRGLAQDIQDNVVRIYESCNFQDLAGQRIGKVMATLGAIELQVSAMLAQCDHVPEASATARSALPEERALLNGPKLDGDSGHASQYDIDKMFN